MKEALVKQVLEGNKSRSMKHILEDFLLRYRTTPHSTTVAVPAELLVRRRLRTRLSLVKPYLAQEIESKHSKQKEYKDLKCHKERLFSENDIVRVRNMQAESNTERWILGKVVKVCGPRTYVVKTGHKIRYVHAENLIKGYDKMPDETSDVDICVPESFEQSSTVFGASPVSNSVPQLPVSVSDEEVDPSLSEGNISRPTPVVLRRS